MFEVTYSAVGDSGQVRSLSRDDGERSRERSDGGETHVDLLRSLVSRVERE